MECPNCQSRLEVISSLKDSQSVTDFFDCERCGRTYKFTVFIIPGITGTVSHSEMKEIGPEEVEL